MLQLAIPHTPQTHTLAVFCKKAHADLNNGQNVSKQSRAEDLVSHPSRVRVSVSVPSPLVALLQSVHINSRHTLALKHLPIDKGLQIRTHEIRAPVLSDTDTVTPTDIHTNTREHVLTCTRTQDKDT